MELNNKVCEEGLVRVALNNGGFIKPLYCELLDGDVAIMNPSILNLDGRLLVNLRATNYVLWHSDTLMYNHIYGPLQYIHPTNDRKLKTQNYLGELNENLDCINFNRINMQFNVEPIWDFHGLEDGRLVYWNNKLYLTGVRRDTTTNGQGRMELSEIDFDKKLELSRYRIPCPNENSYCEKNWMPVLDRDYQYVKWTNPTELLEIDINNNKPNQIKLGEDLIQFNRNVRGSSQVIPYKDYYIALTHSVNFIHPIFGAKNATYEHQFVIWDKDFNLLYISPDFHFTNTAIEFCCGMCLWDDYALVTFSCCDNVAYLLGLNLDTIING